MLTSPSKDYIIYGTDSCSYCVSAKTLLDTHNEPYCYVDVSKSLDAKEMFLAMGLKTVPQIFSKGEFVGGYTELVKHFQ
jgi:glutaredoxin